jgi:hypothetical protein
VFDGEDFWEGGIGFVVGEAQGGVEMIFFDAREQAWIWLKTSSERAHGGRHIGPQSGGGLIRSASGHPISARALALLLGLALVGCTSYGDHVPTEVQALLDKVTSNGYTCQAATRDAAGSQRQWVCTAHDGTVVIDAGDALVDVAGSVTTSPEADSNKPATFLKWLADVVAEPQPSTLDTWIDNTLASGGQQQFNGVLVTLGGAGQAKTITFFFAK